MISIFLNGYTMQNIGLCVLASLVMGFILSTVYMLSGKYTKNLSVTIALLPVLVQVVIMTVNGNIGTSVAVLGAFSLVRFRSIAGSSREMGIIFFAMAIGLVTGLGYLFLAFLITPLLGLILILLNRSSFGEARIVEKLLRITIPEDLNYSQVFDDLFLKYTSSNKLERVKTTNMGTMYELSYRVELKKDIFEKDFLDDIRCRNGNLKIILGLPDKGKGEL